MYPTLSLGFGLQIPTYFLVLSLAVCFSLIWVDRRGAAKGLDAKAILDLSAVVLVMGFLGARLFHVFYEEPLYYWKDPIRILQIWNGGFVYFGGALLGIGSGVVFFLKKLHLPRRQIPIYLDLFAPVASFGYMLGRLGCFLAGCCYGKSCDLPWAVAGRHPTQLYAVIWELGVLMILLSYEKQKPKPGKVFALWILLHGVGRFVMESFRDDFRGPTLGFSISSWISLLFVVAGFLLWRLSSRKSL